MLKVVTEERMVRKCQGMLVKSLKTYCCERLVVTIGHMGASRKTTVNWSESLGIWYFSKRQPTGRYLNAFGVGRPSVTSPVAITCEINLALHGPDRRGGGLLAEDREGKTFVLHRGRIGGGKRGMGKGLFREYYRGLWTQIDEGAESTPVAVIGELGSPRLPRQVAQFIRKVACIKEKQTGQRQMEILFPEGEFRLDYVGQPLSEREEGPPVNLDHDLIVEDLATCLGQMGYRPLNDTDLDLFLAGEDGRTIRIFEVVTDVSVPALQRGLAKLLWNKASLGEQPELTLVLPQIPPQDTQDKLIRLGLSFITFQWQENRAIFGALQPGGILFNPPYREKGIV